MIILLQRVTEAAVHIGAEPVAAIGPGILALVAVQKTDDEAVLQRMLQRLLGYRIFSDHQGKMNLSIQDTGGGLLLVPQFTLAADTRKGMRPSFSGGADPELGKALFERFVSMAGQAHEGVQCGVFGADMQVSLVNDGPVTFWLQSGK